MGSRNDSRSRSIVLSKSLENTDHYKEHSKVKYWANYRISDSSVIVLNNCHYIRSIQINGNSNISETSIEAFIEIAKRNPKINYKFHLGSSDILDFYIKDNFININERHSSSHQKCLQIPANLNLYYFY